MMREKDISIKFQSTLPVRGATNFKYGKRHLQDISIHAPRAGSDTILEVNRAPIAISIHAPRAGSDLLPY